jgi:hypothetical protein
VNVQSELGQSDGFDPLRGAGGESVTKRPPIWRMVREAIETLDGEVSRSEIVDFVQDRYGDVNESSILTHITTCTVNAPARIHDGRNRRPRVATSRYDFLFKMDRGTLVRWDPERHGLWEIREQPDGSVVVAMVGGQAFPTRQGVRMAGRAPITPPPPDEMVLRIPSKETFLRGVCEYERREKRDSMYKVATFLVSHFWSDPDDMADGLGVLLLTWNQAFYRYGTFDFDRLERCIGSNLSTIETFRQREIPSLSEGDEDQILQLFGHFLEALEIASGGSKGKRSPVAVSKALHLLAPGFFPLWDEKIAREYGCYYSIEPGDKYVDFCWIMRAIAKVVSAYIDSPHRTLVKLIDQYNYSRFTRGWV